MNSRVSGQCSYTIHVSFVVMETFCIVSVWKSGALDFKNIELLICEE